MQTERELGGINPIEPLSSLRAHPEWYFKSGVFERETVISLLVLEAELSGHVSTTRIEKNGPWIAIVGDGDWLAGDLRSFSTPTPFPEGGVNAIRIEVLLTAFCDTVATASMGRRDDIESARRHEMPDSMRAALEDVEEGRVVVFRSPLAEHNRPTVIDLAHDIFSPVRVDQAVRRLSEFTDA